MLEIGYGWDIVTLSKETERNREYKHQPVATTPVFYSTKAQHTNKTREQNEGQVSTFDKAAILFDSV